MAQWQRVGFQTQRLGVRIPLASHPFFWPIFFAIDNKKKCIAETGNRTQAAAATTRSPATRLFRLLAESGGSGYRSRFSTLRRLYATMYNNPPCASIGTRTRILSLEGINTTLVLWTHIQNGLSGPVSESLRRIQKAKFPDRELNPGLAGESRLS